MKRSGAALVNNDTKENNMFNIAKVSYLLHRFEKLALYDLVSIDDANKILNAASVFEKSVNNDMVKVAFDSRRIDQEEMYNPRRNLQYYNRSEQFISEATVSKVKNLKILYDILLEIKSRYGRKPEWQDSNARILLTSLENSLRKDMKDNEFSDSQPSVAGLDYISELLYVRYRLEITSLDSLSKEEIKNIILSKDEALTDRNKVLESSNMEIIKSHDNESYNDLLQKLFASVKATKENPDVERSITITVRDKFNETKQ